MAQGDASREWELVEEAIARLRGRVFALVFAIVCGSGLGAATLLLVVRGGPNMGQHLGLLANFFPGYSVSLFGALLGFLYGAALGALVGGSVAWIYNRVADRRHPL